MCEEPQSSAAEPSGMLLLMHVCFPPFFLQTMLYQGSVYITTSEFYGAGRVPSIYWAIIEPNSMATGAITVHGAGVIASKDGLALGFPVIAALASGDGAVVAYSYSGSGEVAGIGPVYAGGLVSSTASGTLGACGCSGQHGARH